MCDVTRERVCRCPELLLYGLAQCKPTWGPLYRRLTSSLMARYLLNPAHIAVIQQVWSMNRSVVIQVCEACEHRS